MKDQEKLQSLVNSYIAGTIRSTEEQELANLVNDLDQETIAGLLEKAWEDLPPGEPVFSSVETATIFREILAKKDKGQPGASLFRRSWLQIAAAILFLLVSWGLFQYLDRPTVQEQVTVVEQPVRDIAPGGNKALLTLSDGSTIVLDNAPTGVLSRQGNTQIVKPDDGQVTYQTSDEQQEVLYNTISTPRGGQYQLTLADGSRVWLNAASSIRFPTAFIEAYRSVEITGEVYFEVAANPTRPFKVNVAGQCEIEVLGTQFNVNAYNDEAAISTTLLEGSVKISTAAGQSSVLQPGRQARLSEGVLRMREVETDEVIAWKTGWFIFNRTDLTNIMRQISRWYDVDVIFEGAPPTRSFSGIVSRDNNVSQVLKIMENAGVQFRIEEDRIIVLQ